MRNTEHPTTTPAEQLREAHAKLSALLPTLLQVADQVDQRLADVRYGDDTVRILVACGGAQVLHVITCTALDMLRGPEHILGGLVHEMTKAVRQKDPT